MLNKLLIKSIISMAEKDQKNQIWCTENPRQKEGRAKNKRNRQIKYPQSQRIFLC
ncbi:MAG TPA: hypothetical protein VMW82_00355 [Candidatus Paceibacterota bacterium]|nr:hypothetical protein [Candidatus Paceibacterota bacterium]